MKRMLLGVGNRLSRDDGAGPILAERLAESDWLAVDCGTSLENAAGIVSRERPDRLVIADAARMGLSPGEVRRLPRPAVDRMLVSTHGLPISFFLDRLQSAARETTILGIEPADLSFGEGLSAEATVAVEWLVEVLTTNPEGIEAVPVLDGIDGPGGRTGESACSNGERPI
jgi:hydrogenase 3 maturation protease